MQVFLDLPRLRGRGEQAAQALFERVKAGVKRRDYSAELVEAARRPDGRQPANHMIAEMARACQAGSGDRRLRSSGGRRPDRPGALAAGRSSLRPEPFPCSPVWRSIVAANHARAELTSVNPIGGDKWTDHFVDE